MPCKQSRTVRLYVQLPNEASLKEKRENTLKTIHCVGVTRDKIHKQTLFSLIPAPKEKPTHRVSFIQSKPLPARECKQLGQSLCIRVWEMLDHNPQEGKNKKKPHKR